MWDPLVNEFPESVHGFRCMLAIKYLQALEDTYEPNTLGSDLIRDLISVIRAKNYVEATRRYNYSTPHMVIAHKILDRYLICLIMSPALQRL
ncbi:coat protein [Okra leaf curl virus]|uniref:coat protein n=1 Tax=Okra leaf curl virus TaxID=163654 RepID=UPI0001A92A3F|nr:coat protein [Okra leaf curl virus]CAQ63435.1 coat protein [Okra leaf curl virus-[Cameroon]]